MTGKAAPMRRPRRSNSLKDIGRLLGIATVSHEPRSERLRAHAAELFDTDINSRNNLFKVQTANLFLHQYGVQLVGNDRVLHIWEEWPGAIGAAWLDDGPAGDVLRHLKGLALDTGAPVPRPAQAARLGVSRWSGTYGGPTSKELADATHSKDKLNTRIMELRDADNGTVAECDKYERRQIRLEEFFPGVTRTAWDAMSEAWRDRTSRRSDPERVTCKLPPARVMAADFMGWRVSQSLPEVSGLRLAQEYLVWRDTKVSGWTRYAPH